MRSAVLGFFDPEYVVDGGVRVSHGIDVDGWGTLVGMSGQGEAPFSYAAIRPYAVVGSLEELDGPVRGVVRLSLELAWGGRTEFDLDDDYDRAAVYKIVLEEGSVEHQRELINGRLLAEHWDEVLPARQVRALWELRFPELRHAA